MTLAKALTYLWLAMLAATIALWIADPARFTADALGAAIGAWGPWALLVFSLVALFRGALLLPSTPVMLAGGVLFPRETIFVFLVSMAGIVASAALLYRFPGFAGYDARLAARYPEQLARLQLRLRSPIALWFVALWAFLPVVPTDLICYAAGLVRMPFRRMLLGIIIGEVPLVTAYVLIGTRVSALW